MAAGTKNHFNIFYSWQSDLDKKANHYFIKKCIEKAVRELKRDDEIAIIPRLDHDTQGEAGSPNITETILRKIDASDMFIADVSIINRTWLNKILKKRLTPNPNVLFELGYALPRLTWNRIICLNNNSFSEVPDMPFDLQQNRISQYSFDGKNDKKDAKHRLVSLLKVAIKAVMDNDPALFSKSQTMNVIQHDTQQFRDLEEIIDELTFKDKLKRIIDNQTVRDEYDLFREMTSYLNAMGNQFMIPELKQAALELKKSIEDMHASLGTTLQSKTQDFAGVNTGETGTYTTYELPDNEAYFDSHQAYKSDRDSRIDRNINAISKALSSYDRFRSTVKHQLYI